MAKQENKLKAMFVRELRTSLPGFVVFAHQDLRTSGVPDLSISGCARTSFIEIKHATPTFESPGIQELTMCRLAAASSYARYVIFQSIRGIDRTLIVLPSIVHRRSSWLLDAEASCQGFNMRWLVEQVRTAHGL